MMIKDLDKVEDAVRAISNVDDYAGSAKALAATTLRLIFISACCFFFLKRDHPHAGDGEDDLNEDHDLNDVPLMMLGTIHHSDKSASSIPAQNEP